MPNDFSDTIHNAEHAVVDFLKAEKVALEQALDKEWAIIKPDVIALGKTVLSQVWQGAVTYVTSGGNVGFAIAAITAQLPADLADAEHIVAAAFAGAVANLQAKAATPAPAA